MAQSIKEIQEAQREALLETTLQGIIAYLESRDGPEIVEIVEEHILQSSADCGIEDEPTEANQEQIDELVEMFHSEIIGLVKRTTASLKQRVRNLTP